MCDLRVHLEINMWKYFIGDRKESGLNTDTDWTLKKYINFLNAQFFTSEPRMKRTLLECWFAFY